MEFSFEIFERDRKSSARSGRIRTAHGEFATPAFLPVGTAASVRLTSPADLVEAGVGVLIANTYHLMHQPGAEVIAELGGLAAFMGSKGPIATDSGGFQVFSLAATRKISADGVTFRSVYDGRELHVSPESIATIQRQLGADIIYPLDECPPYPAPKSEIESACRTTIEWAGRFMRALKSGESHPWQSPFLIVQGGVHADLRKQCAESIAALNPPGFAIGGVSVGEPQNAMMESAAAACEALPDAKPRHLMGVGTPSDILQAIALGMDMFDCVLPTRNARNGQAFTSSGKVNLRSARWKLSNASLDGGCGCYCCKSFTRGYLHHLASADEMLGGRLLSLHNLTFYAGLMAWARTAITAGNYEELMRNRLSLLNDTNDSEM